jgi:hypothetical protein
VTLTCNAAVQMHACCVPTSAGVIVSGCTFTAIWLHCLLFACVCGQAGRSFQTYTTHRCCYGLMGNMMMMMTPVLLVVRLCNSLCASCWVWQ